MRSARAPTNVVHLRDRTVSWLRQPLPLKIPHHPMPRAIHGTWDSEIDARRRRYLEPDPIPKYGELTGRDVRHPSFFAQLKPPFALEPDASRVHNIRDMPDASSTGLPKPRHMLLAEHREPLGDSDRECGSNLGNARNSKLDNAKRTTPCVHVPSTILPPISRPVDLRGDTEKKKEADQSDIEKCPAPSHVENELQKRSFPLLQ